MRGEVGSGGRRDMGAWCVAGEGMGDGKQRKGVG